MGINLRASIIGEQAQQDPFYYQRRQAQQAPEAYDIAAQMLAPLQGYEQNLMGSKAWLGSIEGGIEGLAQRMQTKHPGMPKEPYMEAIRALQTQGQQQKGALGNQMAAFGGTLDPEAFARAAGGVNQAQTLGMANLQAQRAQMDTGAMTSMANALAPFYRQGQQGIQSQLGQLSGLAGNILQSGINTRGVRGSIRYGDPLGQGRGATAAQVKAAGGRITSLAGF